MEHPLILDMAIHTFDQARFLMGAKPVSVWCHEYDLSSSWYSGKASAVATFRMENGAILNYCGSWSAPAHFTTYDSVWRLDCRNGTFLWDGDGTPVYEQPVVPVKEGQLYADRMRQDLPEVYRGRERHDGCLDEMFSALHEQRLAETNCYDNLETMKMVFGACESARLGCEVLLSEL